jgi:hypothetical protein
MQKHLKFSVIRAVFESEESIGGRSESGEPVKREEECAMREF